MPEIYDVGQEPKLPARLSMEEMMKRDFLKDLERAKAAAKAGPKKEVGFYNAAGAKVEISTEESDKNTPEGVWDQDGEFYYFFLKNCWWSRTEFLP